MGQDKTVTQELSHMRTDVEIRIHTPHHHPSSSSTATVYGYSTLDGVTMHCTPLYRSTVAVTQQHCSMDLPKTLWVVAQ